MMQVTVLGTGAPLCQRIATGMMVQATDCPPLVIDTCGGYEFARQVVRVGRTLQDLRHIILTHRHMDHIGGMPALFMANKALDIYALPDTHEGVQALMKAGFPEWPIHPEVQHHPIAPGEVYDIAGYSVQFFATEHRVPTVAVRVSHAGRTLAFSADGLPGAAMVAAAQDADLFLCDAFVAETANDPLSGRSHQLMHPTGKDAGAMAAEAGARALGLLHIGRGTNTDALHAEASAAFGGRTFVCEDGATYQV